MITRLTTLGVWMLALLPATSLAQSQATLQLVDRVVQVREGDDIDIQLVRTNDISAADTVTVNVSISSTATLNEDYTIDLDGGIVTFDENDVSRSFRFSAKDDGELEGTEYATLTLGTASGGASIGKSDSIRVEILDQQNAAVDLDFVEPLSIRLREGENTNIDVRRSGEGTDTVRVGVTSVGVTAIDGVDYESIRETLEYDQGDETQSVRLEANNDDVLEGNELMEVFLESAEPDDRAAIGQLTVEVLIEDDAPNQPGEFELRNTGDSEVPEDVGSILFRVNRLNGDSGLVSVDYGTVDGVGDDGAKAGEHYVATTGRMNFQDGETSQSFEVPIIDDEEPGPQKRNFQVVITNPTSLSTLEPGSNKVTIRILENDGVTDGGGDSDCLGWCCFVATAAYGSYLDPHVEVLRRFRDRHLRRYAAGRMFTAWYYRNSPPLANFIAEHPGARLLARAMLTPIVYSVAYPGTALSLLSLSIFVIIRRRVTRADKTALP
jgi:hypothetical protein